MEHTPEHPIVRNLIKTGYPYGEENIEWPRCPICKEETDIYYVNEKNEIIGCEFCIKEEDAWDWIYDDY